MGREPGAVGCLQTVAASLALMLTVASLTAGCGSSEHRPGTSLDGRAIFRSAGCAGCHTLAAAGAHGRSGPNLDRAVPKPTRRSVLFQLTYGAGGMPSFKGRLSKREMEAVAEFVARRAGAGGR